MQGNATPPWYPDNDIRNQPFYSHPTPPIHVDCLACAHVFVCGLLLLATTLTQRSLFFFYQGSPTKSSTTAHQMWLFSLSPSFPLLFSSLFLFSFLKSLMCSLDRCVCSHLFLGLSVCLSVSICLSSSMATIIFDFGKCFRSSQYRGPLMHCLSGCVHFLFLSLCRRPWQPLFATLRHMEAFDTPPLSNNFHFFSVFFCIYVNACAFARSRAKWSFKKVYGIHLKVAVCCYIFELDVVLLTLLAMSRICLPIHFSTLLSLKGYVIVINTTIKQQNGRKRQRLAETLKVQRKKP